MTGYILRRLLAALPTLAAIVAACFLLLRSIPGDPADARAAGLERAGDPAALEALRREFGLARPVGVQVLEWAGRCVRFDFGDSYRDGTPVASKVARALWATAVLNAGAGTLLVLGSALAGAGLAARRGTAVDRWGGRLLTGLAAIPMAWGAVLLQRLFAVDLGWFPLQGMGPPGIPAGSSLAFPPVRYLCLPVLAAAYPGIALYSRLCREVMLQTLKTGYMTAARARGITGLALYGRHALRNASLTLISASVVLLPALVGGSVVVESVFGWPGAGRLMVEAVLSRDYPVLLALVWVGALFVLAGVLITDLCLGALDPRVRLQAAGEVAT